MLKCVPEYIKEDDFIGQNNLRKKINFYINYQKNNGFIKPLLFVGQRGVGKTTLARKTGFNLKNNNGAERKFIEINGASLSNLDSFINQVITLHVIDRECTLLIDEAHSVNKKIIDWLLSVLSLSEKNTSRAFHSGIEYQFDFSKFNFLAATTNPEKLPLPLKSRLTRLEFEPYSIKDLVKILHKYTKEIEYKDNIEQDIVSHARGCPRIVSENIGKDLKQVNEKVITKEIWQQIKKVLGYLPMGLNTKEIQILRFLEANGPQSLTAIAAHLGLDASATRRDYELFLLSNGLINIAGTRNLTPRGQTILKSIDKL